MSDRNPTHPLAAIELPHFQCELLVYGDIMLDQYWHGLVDRISPEAPIPVTQIQNKQNRAGGAANVALNLSALGVPCHLLGITGHDDAHRTLLQLLHNTQITPHFLQNKNIPTIQKLRVLGNGQQLVRLDCEQKLHNIDQSPLIETFKKTLPNVQCVILSDYAKGTLAQVSSLIKLARDAGLPCLVDPKGHDFNRYRGATVLTPNFKEFTAIIGPCANEEEIVTGGLRLIEQLDLQALLITRGANGMTLLQKSPPPGQNIATHIATVAEEVYDVTGAGDTVISVLAACVASGQDLLSATRLANLAASLAVKKSGASQVSATELRRALQQTVSPNQAITHPTQLKIAINEEKNKGLRIVMTNGCFDILHAGHVHYLEQARKLGDRLIVAVNSDAQVTALKGKGRPINPLEKRMAVLSGLRCVDYVIAFDSPTPQPLIANILPDILVKGGDYQVHDIAGHQEVLANGGQVKILDFIAGCSTSKVIEQIKEKNI